MYFGVGRYCLRVVVLSIIDWYKNFGCLFKDVFFFILCFRVFKVVVLVVNSCLCMNYFCLYNKFVWCLLIFSVKKFICGVSD